ncbi:DUF1761 domain-containing protein [Pelagibacterium luteolum]|uniref:DUF1761 domain-containing protein n=1 Tax=Pelagibacterium luteolum TaxID=440168 RepID=A0A1G7SCH6_9HYPH|nr:DUF1761 domain-containing protein [Pelagibacterium luteolum]SDG20681.1 Protein of unknown function [Pelagibacterium luteolum]
MDYLNVNWLAVVLAMIASMALGAGWYIILSKQWLAATGRTMEQIMSGSGGQATPFIWGAAMQLVMAYFLALLTPMILGEMSVTNAVIVGIHLWAGFIMTSMILNHRYQGASWSLALIDGAYLLGVVILQGIVLGLLG